MSNNVVAQQTEPFSYDEVPYESYSYKNTHPDHLYTIGKLFGMTPPDFATARVLELGCAGGGNLFPLALKFPKASFVGLDLSAEEIDDANEMKKELGLSNIDFQQKDIMEIDESFGTFDYIICHGVFSWVPDEVRTKILDLCDKNMSEQGIAIISYNTLPGWHFVGALRNIMKYHSQFFATPADKVAQGRALLKFLSENIAPAHQHYKDFIDKEQETLSKVNDSYVFHDHLSDANTPFYLHEFNTMLGQHELQYIGDTHLNIMYLNNHNEAVVNMLSQIPDIVQQEQYLDFISNRRFRMSLITHKNVTLSRNVAPEKIFDYRLTANAEPSEEVTDLTKEIRFNKKTAEGHFESSDPTISAFFLALAQFGPVPTTIDEVIARAQKDYGIDDAEALRNVALTLGVQFVFSDFLNLHSADLECATTLSDKPVAYKLARVEAAQNPLRRGLTNMDRVTTGTDHFSTSLLSHLDGTNDAEALTGIMTELVNKGEVTMADGSKPDEAAIGDLVKQALEKFLATGLLEA